VRNCLPAFLAIGTIFREKKLKNAESDFTSENWLKISFRQKNLQKFAKKVLIRSAVPICSSSTPKRGEDGAG
jgi:hypothetical protein